METGPLALIGQAVSEEKMFEHCGRRRLQRRRRRVPEPGYTISSPFEPDGSGELKHGTFPRISPALSRGLGP